MGASISNTRGFTLVEISIVMIIIGLLIGGTFGGMKLIENMQVNKTVQDLKAIESAALTFKDTYGRLPGDIPNTTARLPNCTVAPCATGGNGDRRLSGTTFDDAITSTDERFTFWSHLQAADLVAMQTKNTTDMSFGEGQPETPIGGGFRNLMRFSGAWCSALTTISNHVVMLTMEATLDPDSGSHQWYSCRSLQSIDAKMDDGTPVNGRFKSGWCMASCGLSESYLPNNTGYALFVTRY